MILFYLLNLKTKSTVFGHPLNKDTTNNDGDASLVDEKVNMCKKYVLRCQGGICVQNDKY